MSAAGDTQELERRATCRWSRPATDHSIANDGDGDAGLRLGAVAAVAAAELYGRRLAARSAGYDDDFDDL